MKIKVIFCVFSFLVLIVLVSGCTSNEAPKTTVYHGDDVIDEVEPLFFEYNKSKGAEGLEKFDLKGYVLIEGYGIDNKFNNTTKTLTAEKRSAPNEIILANGTKDPGYNKKRNNYNEFTIIYVIDTHTEYIGMFLATDNNYYPLFRNSIDVAVMYWPEKKIIGWHRIYAKPNGSYYLVTKGSPYFLEDDLPSLKDWIFNQTK